MQVIGEWAVFFVVLQGRTHLQFLPLQALPLLLTLPVALPPDVHVVPSPSGLCSVVTSLPAPSPCKIAAPSGTPSSSTPQQALFCLYCVPKA